MTRPALFLILALLGALFGPAPGAQGQLLPPRDKAPPAALETPGLLGRALLEIRRRQAELHRELAQVVRDIKAGGGLAAAGLLLAVSFLYGVLHAAGPGHGKVVISSYLLTHDSRLRTAFLVSFTSALVQALSAILLVLLFALLLDLPRLEVTSRVRLLELASYALIVLLGLWMLYGALTGRGCGHHHGPGERRDRDLRGPTGWAGRLGRAPVMVLAVGVRPCSGAVIVLLFTLANDLLPVGVAATLAMAAGTGLAVSLLGIASVYGNRLTLLVGRRSEAWAGRLRGGLSLAGALFITAVGAILFAVTYGQPGGPLL